LHTPTQITISIQHTKSKLGYFPLFYFCINKGELLYHLKGSLKFNFCMQYLFLFIQKNYLAIQKSIFCIQYLYLCMQKNWSQILKLNYEMLKNSFCIQKLNFSIQYHSISTQKLNLCIQKLNLCAQKLNFYTCQNNVCTLHTIYKPIKINTL
jgi:hypothetical protein